MEKAARLPRAIPLAKQTANNDARTFSFLFISCGRMMKTKVFYVKQMKMYAEVIFTCHKFYMWYDYDYHY